MIAKRFECQFPSIIASGDDRGIRATGVRRSALV